MAVKKESEIAEEVETEKMVTLKLPLTREQKDDVFVRVNERTWQIKRGEYVTVPACVAEVLDNAERATQESILYQEAHEKVMG